ncbi:hypothetical protein PJ267_00015 [Arthrobacter sp. OVS8]|nr:hypothetical protein PJ267_00015 [Arthrobacter sp. OVS8]
MIKSIGPDRDKVIATMLEFGTDYTYIILSYPPFLKALFDDDRINWEDYDIVAAFGGEGISENMRAHITKYAHSAFGSYGASDLEINLAIETDYTVELRRAIATNPALSARLTKQAEYGVLPMIFQFNPYDYLIETNEGGELVVTIVRKENVNPRIRYNIHDRGHVLRVRDLNSVLREFGLGHIIRQQFLDLPCSSTTAGATCPSISMEPWSHRMRCGTSSVAIRPFLRRWRTTASSVSKTNTETDNYTSRCSSPQQPLANAPWTGLATGTTSLSSSGA